MKTCYNCGEKTGKHKHIYPVPPKYRKEVAEWTITIKPFCLVCYEEVSKAWQELMDN